MKRTTAPAAAPKTARKTAEPSAPEPSLNVKALLAMRIEKREDLMKFLAQLALCAAAGELSVQVVGAISTVAGQIMKLFDSLEKDHEGGMLKIELPDRLMPKKCAVDERQVPLPWSE